MAQRTQQDTIPAPVRTTDVVKRFLLGRPLATARLEHERLGNPTALAVFASDNLSSCAYATEEILRVLIPAVGVAAFALVVPISVAIVAVLAVLMFSYRQTIKAYPTAGGAYIVTKDNFGLMPAQVAGVALLTDYILTVSVSVAAGVQALSSVAPVVHTYRVPISVAFIWIIAWGNLRGVRESGRMFAVPTYLFILSMLSLVAVGFVRMITGHLPPSAEVAEQGRLSFGAAAVTVTIVLKAFASGGAAVTGVEAISNGVPAFKKPAWKNARTTLMWMGSLLGIMFLGLSVLSAHLRVLPVADESKSVLSQVGTVVYGGTPVGRALYYILQASTMLILVLAANTSFADFPRLANFHAGDNFLPRQFTKRGHRLVFSSGILALAFASTILVVGFNASVTNLIPLYALGVFTSFTLSQAGMAKRHVRLREPGWRMGLFFNGLGALTTGVVDLVIAKEKFAQGAWMVMIAVPVMVFLLVRMNHQYEHEDAQLSEGLAEAAAAPPARHRFAVLVDDLDRKTIHALQYALTVGPQNLDLIHLQSDPESSATLLAAWKAQGPGRPLRVIPCEDGRDACLADYAAEVQAAGEELTIVVPGPARRSGWDRTRRGRTGDDVREAVEAVPGVIVTVVRDHGGEGHEPSGSNGGRFRVSPRPRHEVAVFVDRVDRSTLQAIRYAEALRPDHITAYHVGVDPQRAEELLNRWPAVGRGAGVPLEAVFCPDRNIPRTALEIVERLEAPDTEVTVVLPRRTYTRTWHRLLHDRTGRTIARALAGRPHVDVVTIAYRLGHAPVKPRPTDGDADAGSPTPTSAGRV